jgi:DNA-binding CsgD family transcriptional regulator
VLVGRGREVETVRTLLGSGRAVTVRGGAGIGKTSVLRAMAAAAGGPPLMGGALATLGWVPYLPLTRALGDGGLNGDPAAVAAAVRETVGERLLVLDDLQWADAETLGLIPMLVGQVSLLVAVRDGDPGTRRALAVLADAGVAAVELEPLPDDAALRLVRTERAALGPDGAARVVELAGGNPLLLLELAPDGAASPTLRASLEARLARCSPAAVEALALLAVLGRPASTRLVGRGTRELVAAGLVAPVKDGLVPRHALIGDVVASRLSPERRRALHLRLARRLEDAGEAARHLAAAGRTEGARERALAAAAAATRPGERAEHLRLAAACSVGSDADRLRIDAAEALAAAGRLADARGFAEAVSDGRGELPARAWVVRGRARWAEADGAGAAEAFHRALAVAGAEPSAAALRAKLELARLTLWSGADAVPAAREAVALSQLLGQHEALARCLLGCALSYPSGAPEAVGELELARRLAESCDDHDIRFEICLSLAAVLHQYGRGGEGLRLLAHVRDRARTLRLRAWEVAFRWLEGRLLLQYLGAYEHALVALRSCLNEPGVPYPTRDQIVADVAVALALLGRVGEARATLAADGSDGAGWWGRQARGWAGAEVELAAGRPGRAIEMAERTVADGRGPVVLHLALLRDLARLDLGLGPGEFPTVPVSRDAQCSYVPFARTAFEALAQGRQAIASELFLEAARRAEATMVDVALRWQWAAGEALRRASDREGACRLLLEVEERATELRLAPVLTRTRRSLRLCGLRRSSAAARAQESVTPREREVLELVASGATSREIGLRLGVSPLTVDGLVKSAKAKLGARTRRQAAASLGLVS